MRKIHLRPVSSTGIAEPVEACELPANALLVVRCQHPTTNAMRKDIAVCLRELTRCPVIVLPFDFTLEVFDVGEDGAADGERAAEMMAAERAAR